MRSWLIEVNSSPSLSCSNALDKRIKDSLIRDTLNLVRPIPFDRTQLLAFVKPLSDTSKLISPSAYILFYARKDVQKIDLTKIYPTYFKEKRNEKEILSAKWKKPKHKDGSGNEGGLRRNCIVM